MEWFREEAHWKRASFSTHLCRLLQREMVKTTLKMRQAKLPEFAALSKAEEEDAKDRQLGRWEVLDPDQRYTAYLLVKWSGYTRAKAARHVLEHPDRVVRPSEATEVVPAD